MSPVRAMNPCNIGKPSIVALREIYGRNKRNGHSRASFSSDSSSSSDTDTKPIVRQRQKIMKRKQVKAPKRVGQKRIPRKMTPRRMGKIKDFIRQDCMQPGRYGEYASPSWITALIKSLEERQKGSVINSDVKQWMIKHADVFKQSEVERVSLSSRKIQQDSPDVTASSSKSSTTLPASDEMLSDSGCPEDHEYVSSPRRTKVMLNTPKREAENETLSTVPVTNDSQTILYSITKEDLEVQTKCVNITGDCGTTCTLSGSFSVPEFRNLIELLQRQGLLPSPISYLSSDNSGFCSNSEPPTPTPLPDISALSLLRTGDWSPEALLQGTEVLLKVTELFQQTDSSQIDWNCCLHALKIVQYCLSKK